MPEIKIVEINQQGSLLDSSGQELVEDLTKLGESMMGDDQVVMLVQKGSLTGRSSAWYGELNNRMLLDELVARIDRVRKLLQVIRASRAIWIYGFDQDCFDGWFELALSCDRRFCFDPAAGVGFPMISDGALPVGGTFEQVIGTDKRALDAWEKTPVMNARVALKEGHLNAVTQKKQWPAFIQEHLDVIVANVRSERGPEEDDQRTTKPERRSEPEPTEHPTEQTSWALARSLWKRTGRRAPFPATPLIEAEYCALYLLSESWLHRFRDQLMHRQASQGQVFTGRGARILYFSMDEIPPPIGVVSRVLEAGGQIIAVAADVRVLQKGLEQLYARLVKDRGPPQAESLWRQGMAWTLGQEEDHLVPWVSWLVDGTIVIKTADSHRRFFRIAGNHGRARTGWIEVWDGPVDPTGQMAGLLALISDGLIEVANPWSGMLMVSTWIRARFFQEVMAQAVQLEGGLEGVLQCLGRNGWSFVHEEAWWEQYLASRHAVTDPEFHRHDPALDLDADIWEMTLLKEARKYIRSHRGAEPAPLIQREINGHFLNLAAILAHLLLDLKIVRCAGDGNRLVKDALGYPRDIVDPVNRFANLGAGRGRAVCESVWPGLVPGPDWFTSASY